MDRNPVGHWKRRIDRLKAGAYPYLVKKGVPFAGREGIMTDSPSRSTEGEEKER